MTTAMLYRYIDKVLPTKNKSMNRTVLQIVRRQMPKAQKG